MRGERVQRYLACAVVGLFCLTANTSAQQAQEGRPLDALLAEALARNPELSALRRGFDASRARAPQAKALPDPVLSYGYAGNAPLPPFDIQRGDPASARTINFTQEFPYPGKLALKAKQAHVEAEASYWEYEQARLNVMAEVKDAYFDLFYLHKALATIAKNKTLLEKFTRIAEASYTVGKAPQQDVLKAQVEVSKLLEQQTLLEQRRQLAEARLNSLLLRAPEMPVGAPAELSPREFKLTLTELGELALAHYPTLKAQRRRIDRAQYGVELAHKEFYPDFTVGLTYFNRPGLPEMYSVNVGAKLPLYFWQKQRPALAESSANAAAERARLDQAHTLLFLRLKERLLAVQSAQRLAQLYRTTILPQASLALEAALAGYEAGKADFLTLLDSLVTLLNYELSFYEQVSNQEKAIAALEPFTGVALNE